MYKKIILFSCLTSSLVANSFHYYNFKHKYEEMKENESSQCYLCPLEIRKSHKNKKVVINGNTYTENKALFNAVNKKSYAELKYGTKVKYRNYEDILAESRARDTIVSAYVNYAPYKKIINTNRTSNTDGTLVENPESIFNRDDLTYGLRFLTVIPMKYFGITEEKPEYYLETTLANLIDVALYKDMLNGRVGKFYLLVGGGLRVNFAESSNTNFLKPFAATRAGFMFTESMSIWAGVLLRDKNLKDTTTEDSVYDNFYELNLSVGWRF